MSATILDIRPRLRVAAIPNPPAYPELAGVIDLVDRMTRKPVDRAALDAFRRGQLARVRVAEDLGLGWRHACPVTLDPVGKPILFAIPNGGVCHFCQASAPTPDGAA